MEVATRYFHCYTLFTLFIHWLYCLYTVYTAHTVFTVYTIQTAPYCLNSSMYAYIVKVRTLLEWVDERTDEERMDGVGETP